jgi:hypothetical protein
VWNALPPETTPAQSAGSLSQGLIQAQPSDPCAAKRIGTDRETCPAEFVPAMTKKRILFKLLEAIENARCILGQTLGIADWGNRF